MRERATRSRWVMPPLVVPRALPIAAAIVVVAVAVAAVAMIDPGVLCVAPALLLCVPLLFRRYPGERLLVAIGSRARLTRRDGWRLGRCGRLAASTCPRGGLLIARHLAVRPPPALLAAS